VCFNDPAEIGKLEILHDRRSILVDDFAEYIYNCTYFDRRARNFDTVNVVLKTFFRKGLTVL
jgi:hypothetical protein